MGATASDAWRAALAARGVGQLPLAARCPCDRHTTFAWQRDNGHIESQCERNVYTMASLLIDPAWLKAAADAVESLKRSEVLPDSWTRRFSFYTNAADAITLVDPYYAKNIDRVSLTSGSQPSTFELLLQDLDPRWNGNLRIAVSDVRLRSGSSPQDFIFNLVDSKFTARQFGVEVLVAKEDKHLLHDRVIGFQIGRANIDIEVGKGFHVFSESGRPDIITCGQTESGLASLIWSRLIGNPDAPIYSR